MFLGYLAIGFAAKRAARRCSLGTGTALLLLLVAPKAHAIVPTPNGIDPGPCTITVYWDDSWTGCDEVEPESERGRLMAAAGENAIVVMRAWRRRNPELIVPAVQDTSVARREAVEARRKEFADLLRREMARTFAVDSMAVRIASDSLGESEALLRTRYWLARSVLQGKEPVTRQIGWVDYFESWRKVGGRWVLESIEESDELAWHLGVDVARPNQFPTRPGKTMTATEIWERKAGRERDIGVDPSEVALKPEPVTTIQPRYPEFAREAQIQGTVVLEVLVTSDGHVANVRVIKGVTGLNEAAMDAVKRWVFKPALNRSGDPIDAWFEVPFDFHF